MHPLRSRNPGWLHVPGLEADSALPRGMFPVEHWSVSVKESLTVEDIEGHNLVGSVLCWEGPNPKSLASKVVTFKSCVRRTGSTSSSGCRHQQAPAYPEVMVGFSSEMSFSGLSEREKAFWPNYTQHKYFSSLFRHSSTCSSAAGSVCWDIVAESSQGNLPFFFFLWVI